MPENEERKQRGKWAPFIHSKVSVRVELAIRRAYGRYGILEHSKSIDKLTDEEILSVRNIGLKSLKEIKDALGRR